MLYIFLDYPATYGIIALIILTFFGSMGNPSLTEKWVFSSYYIKKQKQYYRLVSPALLHAGIMHLLFNGIGLYFFGPVVESVLGPILTTVLFVVSVAGGSAYTLWVRRRDANYQSLGASGGVSGLVMFAMFVNPHMGVGLLFIPVPIPAWIFGILFSLISIVLTQTPDRNRISHEGHLGGLFIGGFMAWCLIPSFAMIDVQWYLFGFGVMPILLFALVQTIFPSWFYRKKY